VRRPRAPGLLKKNLLQLAKLPQITAIWCNAPQNRCTGGRLEKSDGLRKRQCTPIHRTTINGDGVVVCRSAEVLSAFLVAASQGLEVSWAFPAAEWQRHLAAIRLRPAAGEQPLAATHPQEAESPFLRAAKQYCCQGEFRLRGSLQHRVSEGAAEQAPER